MLVAARLFLRALALSIMHRRASSGSLIYSSSGLCQNSSLFLFIAAGHAFAVCLSSKYSSLIFSEVVCVSLPLSPFPHFHILHRVQTCLFIPDKTPQSC